MPLKKLKSRRAEWQRGELAVEERDALGIGATPYLPGFARPSLAGVPVSSGTALGIASLMQGVKLISENIAKTDVFPARREQRGGWTPATDHPAYDLLRHAPNSYSTPFTFWATLVTPAVVAGIGLAEIKRTGRRVTGLHLLDPSFKPQVEGDRVVYKSGSTAHDAADLIVIRGLSWDGLGSLSPVSVAQDMLGTRIAETRYQASTLGNGAMASGHLEVPGNTSEQQRAQMRQGWNETHQGPDKAGNLGILWGGTKFVPTSYSPADVALIESQNFGVAEVSRLLNIPGWMLGVPEAIKPSSTEEGMALFVALTLSAWFKQIQAELDLKLLTSQERRDLFFWHDTRLLTQGDSRSQVDEADKLIKIGVYSVNEGRLSLGMNPVDDERFNWHLIPVNNLQALETINPTDPAPTQPATNKPEAEPPKALRAMRAVLLDPIVRLARNEAEAVRRAAKRDRFDLWAEDFYPKQVNKLSEALAAGVDATNSILGLTLDARAIAQDIADESLAGLRSAFTTFAPDELPAKLDELLVNWEGRAQTLIERLLGQEVHP